MSRRIVDKRSSVPLRKNATLQVDELLSPGQRDPRHRSLPVRHGKTGTRDEMRQVANKTIDEAMSGENRGANSRASRQLRDEVIPVPAVHELSVGSGHQSH